ncbi:MAG: ion channel [Bacteroidales bacterium]|nr:ion channel [Bacteroidales bacterium]
MMFVTLKKIKIRYNLILFALNFIFVFVIGLVPESMYISEMYSIGVSGIFFASILSVSDKHIKYLYMAIAITVLTWISTYLKLDAVQHFTSIASLAFFFYIIVLLVIQIAQSRQVGALEFLKAINIYFLFGIMGAIVFRTIFLANPHAISFNDDVQFVSTDFVYFSFVTMTTVGFGDITPASPLARTLAIFLSFSGQLYLTMIVALLVGKYLTGKQVYTPSVPTHTLPVNQEVSQPIPTQAKEETKKSDPE